MKNPSGVEIGTTFPLVIPATVVGETDDSLIITFDRSDGGKIEMHLNKNSPQFLVRDDVPFEFKTRTNEINGS